MTSRERVIKAITHQQPDYLKKEFGEKLAFWGGGFVFNTVHNILPDVPPENIIAMFNAVKEFNTYSTIVERCQNQSD